MEVIGPTESSNSSLKSNKPKSPNKWSRIGIIEDLGTFPLYFTFNFEFKNTPNYLSCY